MSTASVTYWPREYAICLPSGEIENAQTWLPAETRQFSLRARGLNLWDRRVAPTDSERHPSELRTELGGRPSSTRVCGRHLRSRPPQPADRKCFEFLRSANR